MCLNYILNIISKCNTFIISTRVPISFFFFLSQICGEVTHPAILSTGL